ncbi:DUF1326 domain-containing protein [Nitrogeniibacter mangrovi]|uniref:DUF1326 domain-containing protein n=1 Tax=Nitrogeniibacter mangrovi TaxID=2016596 RepID=A0A6C1B431_9RHOO|nr:DUF1326 domain-containing protein [Nitrogeniibacter mangrovi]QID18422.1 DUF1326 domain-containing protein [Nitrogeniibacter mangrovi]
MSSPSWQVSGTYFEACNCASMCPCVVLGAPTEGGCTAVVAWHVDSGSYDGVVLDDRNVVLLGATPGHMLETPWKVALYLDERASAEQQQALGAIFSGQVGGPLGALAPLVGEVLGVKAAPIEFSAEGTKRRLRVSTVIAMDIAAIEGQGGKPVTVENVPFTPVPGFPAVLAKSSALSIHDHGFDLDISDRNGFYSPFAYQA